MARRSVRERADAGRAAALNIDAKAAAKVRSTYQRRKVRYEEAVDALARRHRQQDRLAQAGLGRPLADLELSQVGEWRALLTEREALATTMRLTTEDRVVVGRTSGWLRGLKDARQMISVAAGEAPARKQAAWRKLISDVPQAARAEAYDAITGGAREVTRMTAGWEADALSRLEERVTRELATGADPRAIAQAARSEGALDVVRGETLTRTETMRAYRAAVFETYRANEHLIGGWVWRSSLDSTTCGACWAMHGTKHSLDEELEDHPRGKCVPVPLARSYEEVGIDAPDARPDFIDGETRLREAGPDVARAVLGPGAYQAWSTGKIRLSDLVHTHRHPVHGNSVRRAPNYQAIRRASSRASSARARARAR